MEIKRVNTSAPVEILTRIDKACIPINRSVLIYSISVKKQTSTSSSSEVTTNTVDSQVVLQQQMKDIKEAFEEERQNMKNEFEAMKKELLKTNKRLQSVYDLTNFVKH